MLQDQVETFGGWVRQQRKLRDLTQHELAQQIGCSFETVRKMESDSYRPSKHMITRVATCLNVPAHQHATLLSLARSKIDSAPAQLMVKVPAAPRSDADFGYAPLPLPPNALLGRSQQLQMLQRCVVEQGVRLLTLTGPGGVGKTRLALQLITDLRSSIQQRIYFISLAPVHDPALLLTTIAQHLSLTEFSEQHLSQALGAEPTLLVLDNFEHLLPAAPQLTALLASTAQLTLIVTSRARLQLYGEYEIHVPPLELPHGDQLPPLSELAQMPTIALFVERAQAVQASFALTDENAACVAEICQRLDGLPLAIELAAARIKLLTPRHLLTYLSSRLELLTAGPQDRAERQQTLRKTIDWSYTLLSPTAQALFAQLGVFAGGCTLDALTAVCTGSLASSYLVFNSLTILLDNSMLQRAQVADNGEVEVRFVMLETLREYALEVLEQRGELNQIRQQHAAYYLALAETAEPLLKGSEQQHWVVRLEADHHNFRAALTWGSTHDPELALRLSAALTRFWYMHGHFSEGRAWLQTTLDQGQMLPAMLRARGLYGLGVLAYVQGEYDQATTYYEASLELRRELGDRAGIAAILNNLGLIKALRGDNAAAVSLYAACVPLWRQLGDHWGLANALGNLGILALDQLDFAAAAAYYHEALALRNQLEDLRGRSTTLSSLGWVAYYQGAYALADTFFDQSLLLAYELADELNQAEVFQGQAWLSLARGDLVRARCLMIDSVRIRRQHGQKYALVLALEAFAALLLAEGQATVAPIYLGAAAAWRETLNTPCGPLERLQRDTTSAQIVAQIGQPDFERAWESGGRISPEQILDQLLGLAPGFEPVA